MNQPLVTCLCLTRGRREWLPVAIECFRRQTYENRELLIVPDVEADYEGLIPDDARIRVAPAVAWRDGRLVRVVVGTKRNYGCELALGELVAIWDDDDFSAAGRLEHQVGRIRESGRILTGYNACKFTDGSRWWLWHSAGEVLASSMCFVRAFWQTHPFKEINCGQDERFAMQAGALKQLDRVPDMELMYATIHPGNTSPRQVQNRNNWTPLPGFRWEEMAA